ncbi:hypothetical protein UREG_07802 [Uncinocarpus reesii 1704]|uniref:1-phosphatidylinositol 4-kinase n=1 Tax=Uncinocarpus reesii (strain UAMH 1704) TaxID=336963 RepID=C4K051_UNCRE|nr:uncharacterized protein UREG_07802 [Uncinocarpus reesii 1704]EEP82937.1 hypothetical protein UREG_07802 [Uncinocarpus reesii 1704]
MSRQSTYIRRAAFERLATLTAKHSEPHTISDLDRLRSCCQRPAASPTGFLDGVFKGRVAPSPIRFRELDALLALCEAAKSSHRPEDVAKLVVLFTDYLPDCPSLTLHPSPFLHSFETPPWELLTRSLITALLSLGSRHASYHDQIYSSVLAYIDNCYQLAKNLPALDDQGDRIGDHGNPEDIADVATVAVSLVGLLDGMSTAVHFFSPNERLHIIKQLRLVLSEDLLVAVETTSSTIRNLQTSDLSYQHWRRYARVSAAGGRPLSSMLLQKAFLGFVKACTSPISKDGRVVPDDALLDRYINSLDSLRQDSDDLGPLAKYSAQIAIDQVQLLEEGSDYLQLGVPWQQHLAFTAKAFALVIFVNCIILDEDAADIDVLISWLESTILDVDKMANKELATVTFKAFVVLSKLSRLNAPNLTRSLLRFIVQNRQSGAILAVAARSLAQNLQLLSQDTIIGTLYSLGNVLSANPAHENAHQHASMLTDETNIYSRNFAVQSQQSSESIISFTLNGEEDTLIAYKNVVHAIITVATSSKDGKIIALAQSMLLQKIGRVNILLDACIVEETVALALEHDPPEFQLLLKFYARLYRDAAAQGNALVVEAVHKARNYLAICLQKDNPLFRIYLIFLLESIVNKGGATDREKDRTKETELSSEEIYPYLPPVASLLAKLESVDDLPGGARENGDILSLLRDTWFNIAAHGIVLSSEIGYRHREELRVLANLSPPLISENRAESLESDIELNTVLRRGLSSPHSSDRKKSLIQELPALEHEIKRLSYPKVVFLNATLLLESLRASSGNFTKVLIYSIDPALNSPDIANCMRAIVDKVVTLYLERALSNNSARFSAPFISQQLAQAFIACCHRIESVQQTSSAAAAKIIAKCPSSLCEKRSLFTLLDLLTLLWSSCLDEELDEYEWKSTFTSVKSKVEIELSDNYEFRKHTLNNFYNLARSWVVAVTNIAPLDVKGLLQTYLSEYDDDGGYGHTSLGRSFALEIGSIIPLSDHRLANGAGSESFLPDTEDICETLSGLESQISQQKKIPLDTPRNVLRRAAARLCNRADCEPSLISHLVNIPFQIFTKESIKMGISLWLGVINENPETQPRIIVEVAQAWERTLRRKKGIFDPSFNAVTKLQRKAQNIISPHLRLLQFFESHFNATRLASPQIQKIFRRLVNTTLNSLRHTAGHPLAREFHFHTILFSLKVLRYCKGQSKVALWKLKDQILSAALSWFSQPPRWSFGANRLQIKAEDKILQGIESYLSVNSWIEPRDTTTRKSLKAKQDLVLILVENERSRLKVWLSPLDTEKRHHPVNKASEGAISGLLRLAWAENPSLAIQLSSRFPSSKLQSDVRWLVFNFPEKTLNEPDSLEILLGSSLPQDITFQLKVFIFLLNQQRGSNSLLQYLLFWAPTNPIAAVTYFLPAYGNHPFIIQYAMRALESHSVDVSFFYIPQLVQALRYDALGYVERYLFETAQLSPHFAHQVIWNMKANAFKDEDSQIPDPVKPALDKFMDELISSFSDADRDFYEREFSFFHEITDISGKLRPYIKRSKPEKKEKIEEELRKIKVEVGVYLPSNPDGVVVGIDPQSL